MNVLKSALVVAILGLASLGVAGPAAANPFEYRLYEQDNDYRNYPPLEDAARGFKNNSREWTKSKKGFGDIKIKTPEFGSDRELSWVEVTCRYSEPRQYIDPDNAPPRLTYFFTTKDYGGPGCRSLNSKKKVAIYDDGAVIVDRITRNGIVREIHTCQSLYAERNHPPKVTYTITRYTKGFGNWELRYPGLEKSMLIMPSGERRLLKPPRVDCRVSFC